MQKRRRKEKENRVLPELAKMAPGALLPGGQSCAFVPTRLSSGTAWFHSPSPFTHVADGVGGMGHRPV